MFSSKYFSLPLSVPYHHCSTPTLSPTTHPILCFPSSTSGSPCQYHSAIAPYSFIRLPPKLYNVSLPVPPFPPDSTIPPLLHTHSITYHTHYIIFLSQYFSSPCQYHSTIAPYTFNHLPTTLYNVFLPILQVPPVRSIPPVLHSHSFTYHPQYIMFLSQYFSFPLSVPFHHCSIPIQSTNTLTIKCFSPSTSVTPVSNIQPLFHTHSFTYHPHYIIFLYQYFRFPLSVPFHNCYIHIHSTTTHTV